MEFIDDTRAEFYSTTRKSGSRAECERRGCCRFEVENVDCPLTSSSKDCFFFQVMPNRDRLLKRFHLLFPFVRGCMWKMYHRIFLFSKRNMSWKRMNL